MELLELEEKCHSKWKKCTGDSMAVRATRSRALKGWVLPPACWEYSALPCCLSTAHFAVLSARLLLGWDFQGFGTVIPVYGYKYGYTNSTAQAKVKGEWSNTAPSQRRESQASLLVCFFLCFVFSFVLFSPEQNVDNFHLFCSIIKDFTTATLFCPVARISYVPLKVTWAKLSAFHGNYGCPDAQLGCSNCVWGVISSCGVAVSSWRW